MSPDPAARPRANVIGALVEGWRRVFGAPALTLGVPAALLLVAALPAMAARATSEGPSIRRALEPVWTNEMTIVAATGGRSMSREVMGFGGTLALGDELGRRPRLGPAMRVAVLVAIAFWILVTGGAIDRLARGRPVSLAHFAAVSFVFLIRFVRLFLIVGLVFWAIHASLVPWLRADLSTAARVTVHVLFVGLLAGVSIVTDFAQIRAVVEDRISMIGALVASMRFVGRRWVRVLALYVLNAAIFAVLLLLCGAFPIGPDEASGVFTSVSVAFAYLVVRAASSLALTAASTVFFQNELAHARYTASPQLVWPDSPAAEAINNLRADDAR